ncbi:hypothetical protein SAMN05421676_102333 [Salinibacillus kushneri]|uniref:Uncharacterized protein n=1 Tax=Salinibacillus kushneri TaxID=237682 RepID=A0A1I0B4A1_9BACI|nr:hypothetical protein SAMN05421676_102333 [Salinibacillus kushneri]
MCPLCNGRGVMWVEVAIGCAQVEKCPDCEPKSREQLDKELADFNKRLSDAIYKHEVKAYAGIHSS